MTVKFFATAVTAVAAVGAAAAGMTSLAPAHAPAPQVVPVVHNVPLDPPGQFPLPSPEQLTDICNRITDPGVNYKDKYNLVENGISSKEGHEADEALRRAFHHGNFPEQFAVSNIQQIPAPGAVKADVAMTGPKFPAPVTNSLVFIDQGGNWVMQHDSALALVKAASTVN
ncbi:hypothetical protein PT015_08055 [Candidatus Mycobacterium wuenschmannii]|uniref:Low molecular weight antigen MTB12-like C-terminal domain-containing protein n=1 Tax=Candidatus Mycobacterium wuenschmannii TaxID=3027808 RepID=A0ABY8W0J3_9MYCO|nr:hypothetical protein [Candidatus Mycobacterium wuenschmannii]WIM89383.1 hypothetical protein PT015_08055 [Candidatus Mycobacterium wuenschmannii]